MSIFKCKMCGGALEIVSGTTVAECEYCGTRQTLPKLDDEKKANLYDRANHFRRNNEFDKAMSIYEQILNNDNTDSEAYWSLVLCRYGIEYVEDPVSHKRIPTVNRAQFTSVFDDEDYRSALRYADDGQREVYQEEAKAINDIQKGILAISQKEEPFDVFICYKESDAGGRRTPDSVLATELYHELTREGFKVFFSRITLEDKLGSAYEPYIFAALNTSKVMVVLGTKPEYFNAVWVKNEWSRYLALIKNGERKMLIPAYKDMDPYDLPEEFSHLMAQNMSKLGFMQDLVYGIKKIVQSQIPKASVVKETVITRESANVDTLLKRAFIFIDDGDFISADEYCEKVLDIEPENALAYLGKLMTELRVTKQELLKDVAEPFDNSGNYQKVIRYASYELKATLESYVEHIHTRNNNARLSRTYNRAKTTMQIAKTESSFKEAAELFESICEYKDSNFLAMDCRDKALECRIERERIIKQNKKIILITSPIILAFIAIVIVVNFIFIPNYRYNSALGLMDDGQYTEAMEAFEALGEYKDSSEKAKLAYQKYVSKRLKYTNVGESIRFGSYEQDNNKANGKEDIEWIVLSKDKNRTLVISKYALDCKPYNTKYKSITWETCSLRKWLNSSFINTAFSAEEKEIIAATVVTAYQNPTYDKTKPGEDTQDKIFLLSINEASEYFASDDARICKPTKYAVANGAYTSGINSTCAWWLRTGGLNQGRAANVYIQGLLEEYGADIDCQTYAVRPAMWINTDE